MTKKVTRSTKTRDSTVECAVWTRTHDQPKRRRDSARQASSILVTLCLIVASVTYLYVALPGSVRAGNNVIDPCPHCGGGGPTYDLIVFYSAVMAAGVCVSSSCSGCNSPIANGDDLYVQQGVQVTISPCGLGGTGDTFSQWLSNSGALGNPTSPTTTFTPESNNSLWLIVGSYGLNNYAGYAVSYPGMTVNSVGATITVPSSVTYISCPYGQGGQCPKINVPGYGDIWNAEVVSMWVGLASGDSSAIWQAGIDVIAGTTLPVLGSAITVVTAWYEAYPNPTFWLYNFITIGLGHSVNVDVSKVNATSAYYYFYDNTNHQINQNYVSFAAPTRQAEWIVESPQLTSGNYIIMPTVPAPVFANPTAALSCSPNYCPPLGNTYESAVYEDMLSRTYSCGWYCTVTENAFPSLLVSPYTSFSVLGA